MKPGLTAVPQAMQDIIRAYERKVHVCPGDVDARYCLGLGRMYEGRWHEAAQEFQWVIRLLPGFKDAYDKLADVLVTLGEYDQAAQTVEHVSAAS